MKLVAWMTTLDPVFSLLCALSGLMNNAHRSFLLTQKSFNHDLFCAARVREILFFAQLTQLINHRKWSTFYLGSQSCELSHCLSSLTPKCYYLNYKNLALTMGTEHNNLALKLILIHEKALFLSWNLTGMNDKHLWMWCVSNIKTCN